MAPILESVQIISLEELDHMNRQIVLVVILFCTQFASSCLLGSHHQDQLVSKILDITVTNAWTPALPPNSKVSAGYFSLTNHGTETLTLVNVASPAYGSVEIHETTQQRETATMSRLSDIKINPREEILFAPGGKHLMLRDPHFSGNDLSSFIVMLVFSNGLTHQFTMNIKRRKNDSSLLLNRHMSHSKSK